MPDHGAEVAVVDYGMGNLFSVKHACERVGLKATITASSQAILAADAVILPGVGAFGEAMAALENLGLVNALREVAASGKPLVGICLGMQLLMTESYEFGHHRGLRIVEGDVVRLEDTADASRKLKVPQVGWNSIHREGNTALARGRGPVSASWDDTPLDGLADGEYMYFVHSFYVRPLDPNIVLSVTRYGSSEFCSSLRSGNVFACQFHPERSGLHGLRVYRNLAAWIRRLTSGEKNVRKSGNEVRVA